MATSNKAISAYLPPDLEEYLTKYCTEYDITRKDKSGEIKPALGTAVVEILKIFFSNDDVPSPLPDNVPLLPSNVITESRLKEILSELEAESKTPSNLPSNVVTEEKLNEVLSELKTSSKVSSTILSNVVTQETLDKAIASSSAKLTASLREEIQPWKETEKQVQKLLGK